MVRNVTALLVRTKKAPVTITLNIKTTTVEISVVFQHFSYTCLNSFWYFIAHMGMPPFLNFILALTNNSYRSA